MRALIAFLLVFLVLPAALGDSGALQSCVNVMRPEDLFTVGPDSVDTDQMLYATCRELTAPDSLCEYYPGGMRSSLSPQEAPRRYRYVMEGGEVGYTDLFEVCHSKAPAYLFIAALMRGKDKGRMLAAAAQMRMGARVSPESIVQASLDIYRSGKLVTAAIPARLLRSGLFNYLVGRKACAGIALDSERGECEAKAATMEAIRSGDSGHCLPGDTECQALLGGQRICAAIGRRLVRRACENRLKQKRDLPASQPSS